jgi:hypothetical protein
LNVNLANDQELEALKLMISVAGSEVQWIGDSESPDRSGLAEIMVSPKAASLFTNTKVFQNVEVVVEDVEKNYEDNKKIEEEHPYINYKESANEFFEAYRDYDEIVEYFDGLIAEFPNLIRKIPSIGKSYYGVDVWAVVIGNAQANPSTAVFWNGLQHCREWIAGHSLMFTADALVRRYSTDSNIRELMDNVEFHIVPVFNPDGYNHTRNVDSMWRKNRQPNSGSSCIGTDLNRNWRYQWSTIGSSNNPCSDTYHGAFASSSPETTNIDMYVRSQPFIQGYIDWHSSGNLWMTPWGCYSYDPEDIDELMETGQAAAAAIRTYRGTIFRVGPIYDIIYPVSGSSCDTTYADTEMNRVQSYALEIGTSFQPNAREIVPTGEEMLRGALVHAEHTLLRVLREPKINK